MGLNSFQTSGNSPGGARCRVGLLGFGPLGLAIARRLTSPDAPPSLHLTHVCDRRARDKRSRHSGPLLDLVWTDRLDDLLTSDIDVVIESVTGSEPASDYVRAALLAGKSVVTASKRLVAHHGPALLALAERQGRQLRFGAAVGGAMPLVRLLVDGVSGDRVVRVEAILSGACNAVLSQMDETDGPMDAAVADACARGLAEADPSADLDGSDAATKLVSVCALAFGLRVVPDQIDTRTSARVGAEEFRRARARSGTIRQIAHADYDRERGVLSAWVAPRVVPHGSLFAATTGAGNAAIVTGAHAGEVTVTGIGAGPEALSAAMIGDVVVIARDRAAIVPAPILTEPRQITGLSDLQLAEAV